MPKPGHGHLDSDIGWCVGLEANVPDVRVDVGESLLDIAGLRGEEVLLGFPAKEPLRQLDRGQEVNCRVVAGIIQDMMTG
ncbi:MAG TPA: hypothetical protein VMH22_08995 [bacterium]|nr:hypothetical protein [bacterium]